jgi:hypothetical protein
VDGNRSDAVVDKAQQADRYRRKETTADERDREVATVPDLRLQEFEALDDCQRWNRCGKEQPESDENRSPRAICSSGLYI